MAELEQLKQKYASVLQLIKSRNVRLDHLHVQDGKLFMQGAAPNEQIKNEVWSAIKSVDASYSDLTADLSVDSSLPAPAPQAQKYTVKPGDSLSKIAKHFYGDANQYMRIFDANQDQLSDPNQIQAGQELNIPA
jgi:nucleoid-associated protein YgaU